MARAHMQMDVHALDTFLIAAGSKSSRSMYGSAFSMISAEMASLSYDKSDSRNFTGSFTRSVLWPQ